MPGEPKMARAALSRRALDGPNISKLTWYTAQQGDACLASRRATYGPYRAELDEPKMARIKWEGLVEEQPAVF